jgi:carbonic anhydrase
MSMQSPIDITRDALVPLAAGSHLEFFYPEAPVAAEVRFQAADGDPIGGLVEVVPEVVVVPREGEARVELGGSAYRLQSLHWHTPSEHWPDGRPLPLELHLVHRRAEDGAFLVAGVLYRMGEPNRAIALVFDLLDGFDPADLAPGAPQVATARLSPAGLLPVARTTYRYPGSLTTAPFTEGVSWVVFAELVEAGAEQVAAHDRLVSAPTPACGDRPNSPGNARRLQPLGNRAITTDLVAGLE